MRRFTPPLFLGPTLRYGGGEVKKCLFRVTAVR